jgi:hypothetical protein
VWNKRTNQKILPTSPTDYPVGTFIKTEKGYYYLLNDKKRLRIISKRVLDSWSPARIVETTEAAVKHYRITSKLKFRNGSLLYSYADARIYLVVDGRRCPMLSPDAFDKICANPKEAVPVSVEELNLHQLGDEIK